MSNEFRELLKKVGSGLHTKKDLTRTEASLAMKMMLEGEATPAQIGAFLIAHRIKRPTGIELAGMLDTYEQLSKRLSPSSHHKHQVRVLGIPYDGRSRTAPVTLITALILAIAEIPVIIHGADKMPTKYGIPLLEIWQSLGLDFTKISEGKVQETFNKTGFAYYYTPKFFPLTQQITTYRDEIGKRPPIATIELIWSPYEGEAHIISGYVHPPTEQMIRKAFQERGTKKYTLVKGLEGSIDLCLSKTTIVAVSPPENSTEIEYLKINPRDYGFDFKEIPLESPQIYYSQLKEVLAGKSSPLTSAAIWNGGFYLWHCGISSDLKTGLETAENLIIKQKVQEKLTEIKSIIQS